MFSKNCLFLAKNKSYFKKELYRYLTKLEIEEHPDILCLQHKLEKEEINRQLKEFNTYLPIKLKYKYVIIENIDFYSLAQQEIFLKYIEDSKLHFYFTASDIFKIQSPALLSRVHIKTYEAKKLSEYLDNKILQIYEMALKEDIKIITSESEMIIKYRLKPIIDKIDTNFLYATDKIIKTVKDLEDNYPIWYTLQIIYLDLFSNNESINIMLRSLKLEDTEDLVNFLNIRYWTNALVKSNQVIS